MPRRPYCTFNYLPNGCKMHNQLCNSVTGRGRLSQDSSRECKHYFAACPGSTESSNCTGCMWCGESPGCECRHLSVEVEKLPVLEVQ